MVGYQVVGTFVHVPIPTCNHIIYVISPVECENPPAQPSLHSPHPRRRRRRRGRRRRRRRLPRATATTTAATAATTALRDSEGLRGPGSL